MRPVDERRSRGAYPGPPRAPGSTARRRSDPWRSGRAAHDARSGTRPGRERSAVPLLVDDRVTFAEVLASMQAGLVPEPVGLWGCGRVACREPGCDVPEVVLSSGIATHRVALLAGSGGGARDARIDLGATRDSPERRRCLDPRCRLGRWTQLSSWPRGWCRFGDQPISVVDSAPQAGSAVLLVSISSKHRPTAPRTLCVSRRRSTSRRIPRRPAVPAGRWPSTCPLDNIP